MPVNSIIRSIFGGKGGSKGDEDTSSSEEVTESTAPESDESSDEQTKEESPSDEVVAAPPAQKTRTPREQKPATAAAPEVQADDDKEEATKKPVFRSRPKNAKELFEEAIPERAKFAGPNLRAQLKSKIRFSLKPSGTSYLVDCTEDVVKCVVDSETTAESKIALTEADLMRIVSGELNPQIAMLSHKVQIEGNPNLAMYVFNLIAPQSNF